MSKKPEIINSEPALQGVLGLIRALFAEHKYLRIAIKTGKDRTLDHNAVSHIWYQQLGRELREHSVLGWRCYCKLHHGCPILCSEDDDFREFFRLALAPLAYEQRIKAMEYVPVTSLMTVKQMSAYMDAVQADFATRGVLLEYKEDGK